MKKYIALLRGVNISGKNKITMPELKGFANNFTAEKALNQGLQDIRSLSICD